MDLHGTDRIEDLDTAETPEDVAVLYSWANLHGAKYRDFSASRREYRAQLRHRAAEQVRDNALLAKAEAEAAALAADSAPVVPHSLPMLSRLTSPTPYAAVLREAEEAARIAAAERVEAARSAEAAAVAEAAARREEREIAEAHASAQRQAARYADSEIRRRAAAGQPPPSQLPGQISDPYTPQTHIRAVPSTSPFPPVEEVRPSPLPSGIILSLALSLSIDLRPEPILPPPPGLSPRTTHPVFARSTAARIWTTHPPAPQSGNVARRPRTASPRPPSHRIRNRCTAIARHRSATESRPQSWVQRRADQQFQPERRSSRQNIPAQSSSARNEPRTESWPPSPGDRANLTSDPGLAARRDNLADQTPAHLLPQQGVSGRFIRTTLSF